MSSLVVSSIANASGQAFAVPNGISGNIKATTGNLVIGTAGKGIDFDPAGSGAAANLLDDYEEGTFTPAVTGGSGASSGGTFTGYYTKIGRLVYVTLSCTSVGKNTLAGEIKITGLPFEVVNSANASGVFRYGGFSSPASAVSVIPQAANLGTAIQIQFFSKDDFLGVLDGSNLGGTFHFYNFTYTYHTN